MKVIPTKVWIQAEGWRKTFMKRKPSDEPRVVIVGLGRAGTTFLMQLLTRLGYDTGAEPYNEPYHQDVRAGFELLLTKNDGNLDKDVLIRTPQVIKAPALSVYLNQVVDEKDITIKHLICPIREIRETAQSREDVGLFYLREHQSIPMDVRIPNLFSVLGKIVEVATLENIPLTPIAFPRMVEDPRYLYECLFKDKDIFNMKPGYQKFKKVYDKLANPK